MFYSTTNTLCIFFCMLQFHSLYFGTPFISIHIELLHFLKQLYSISLNGEPEFILLVPFICLLSAFTKNYFLPWGRILLCFLLYLQQLELCLIHSRFSINIHSMECWLHHFIHEQVEFLGQGPRVVVILLAIGTLPSMEVIIIYPSVTEVGGDLLPHLCQYLC